MNIHIFLTSMHTSIHIYIFIYVFMYIGRCAWEYMFAIMYINRHIIARHMDALMYVCMDVCIFIYAIRMFTY